MNNDNALNLPEEYGLFNGAYDYATGSVATFFEFLLNILSHIFC